MGVLRVRLDLIVTRPLKVAIAWSDRASRSARC
jgi:hypothetical protein